MKRIVSVLLCAVLLCGMFSAAASAATAKGNEYPIILVNGRGAYTPYYSASGKKIFPVSVSTDFLVDALKECLPYLGKGLLTGDLEPWADKVAGVMAPLYAELIPNKDGSITNGSVPSILDCSGKPPTKGTSTYDYSFNYDWRKDPCVSADHLDMYIQQIKELEHCDKVSLVGRCYGANVVSAYLYEYGHEDIDTVIYYCSTALGCYASGCLFAGEIELDTDVLETFLEKDAVLDDPVLNEFVCSTVSYLNSFYGLEFTADLVNAFIKKVFPVLAPKVAPICYGSMPCFWDMVDNSRYEKAKALCFNGIEEEYAAIIEMADHYHYDIMAHLKEMLTKYSAEGLNIGIVSKYGEPAQYPIYGNGAPQSDNTVELELSSFGTTCSEYGTVLSEKYLGTVVSDYISSDLCVDASTAAFKEFTWYIKGIEHSTFPQSIDKLICTVCNYDGQMTVRDDEAYPRFLKYDENTAGLSPLTDAPEKKTFRPLSEYFEKLGRFLKAFFALIKQLLSK